jgi:hypothetical protein
LKPIGTEHFMNRAGILGACGLVLVLFPAVAGAAGTAERCAAASTQVSVQTSSVQGWSIQAAGIWSAAGGADGVLLEYRIDMDRYQSETRTGTSGSWSISQEYLHHCGKHTLRVFSFPMIRDGDRVVACLENGSSTPRPFEFSCEPVARIDSCDWKCSEDECRGTCTGSAREGVPDYAAYWGLNNAHYEAVEGFTPGPWTHDVTCQPGEKVTFKVRGRNGTGVWSKVAERVCGE